MNDLFDDYEWAKRRRPDRIYISKRFPHIVDGRYWRFGGRVFLRDAMPEILKEKDEFVLRTTDSGIQQIKIKFLEDDRRISYLWLQRLNTKTERPMGAQIVLYGDEITKFMEFLVGIQKLEIQTENTFNRDFDHLRWVHEADADARNILSDNPGLVAEFARSELTTEDVIALGYRRQELATFRDLLDREEASESEWQSFFERNKWIFGYGLAYVFTTNLDERSLQETIRGASLQNHGKRPDGIMKTRAAISALCLVEIKKHQTRLLKQSEYRSGTWAPTAELSGAVAQSQENARVAIDQLGHHYRFTDDEGNPTGEEVMAVQPRSFLIVGNLSEFQGEHGPNVARYRSFEDYRRNLRQPEILTFDELYERARFIVASDEASG